MAPGLNNLEIIPFRVAAYDMKVGTFILELLRFIFFSRLQIILFCVNVI